MITLTCRALKLDLALVNGGLQGILLQLPVARQDGPHFGLDFLVKAEPLQAGGITSRSMRIASSTIQPGDRGGK